MREGGSGSAGLTVFRVHVSRFTHYLSRLPLFRRLFALGGFGRLFLGLFLFNRLRRLGEFEGASKQAREQAAAHERIAEEFKRGGVTGGAYRQRLNPPSHVFHVFWVG